MLLRLRRGRVLAMTIDTEMKIEQTMKKTVLIKLLI